MSDLKKVAVVTSFSEKGWNDYAEQMIWTAAGHWEPSIKLIAYYHDFDINTKNLPNNKNIEFRNLNDLEELNQFRDTYKKFNGTSVETPGYNWRMDAIKFCHKVFAIADCAFERKMQADKDNYEPDWLVWLDADTATHKDLSQSSFLKSLPDVDLVHLGRKHFTYSETSFVGFNLNSDVALEFIGDLVGAYITGEILNYREWHDGFLFERLLIIYKAHGLKFMDWTGNADIKDPINGDQAFDLFPLSKYVNHYKGNKKKNISNTVAPDINGPKRYGQLLQLVDHYKPKTIAETGTWNGGRAIQMAEIAFRHSDEVTYYGYDLFEEATTELDEKELNSKQHNLLTAVENRLEQYQKNCKAKNKTFNFKLFKGDTKYTLQQKKVDFAYIDGGHSEETVNHDYDMLKESSVIVFDDFVSKDPNGNDPGEEFYGVNKIIEKVDKRRKVLPSSDGIVEGGITHLAVVLTDDDLPDLPVEFSRSPIVVQPRDCMPKEDILNNVKKNTSVIDTWITKAKPNSEVAIIISGGQSTDWKKVKQTIKKVGKNRAKVVCVKHSYPELLKNNIEPFACVILDPRPITGVSTHGVVRKDLFKEIDDNTLFMTASMTDPSVVDLLREKTSNIVGWHAYTNALQENIKEKVQDGSVKVDENLGIKEGATMIIGGTCAAMRSIGIMHTLGFREFHLFGYDCSMPEPSEEEQKEVTEEGKPKYLKVGVDDESFWTTGELLAMAQDCEKLFEKEDVNLNINFHGEGTLVSKLWSISDANKLRPYKKVLNLK
tara:strand:- start:700 stop:3018 length:2319 start_codon:yes stop_codon:yes gene_type:complete